jgi:hypothetical protein
MLIKPLDFPVIPSQIGRATHDFSSDSTDCEQWSDCQYILHFQKPMGSADSSASERIWAARMKIMAS